MSDERAQLPPIAWVPWPAIAAATGALYFCEELPEYVQLELDEDDPYVWP